MNLKAFFKLLGYAGIFGVVIGILLGILDSFATKEQLDTIKPLFALTCFAVVIFILTYTILKVVKFTKEIKRLAKILYEDIDVERYISETKDAITRTKNKRYKLLFSLNLALGYDAKGEYQSAIDTMTNLNVKDAMWVYKALYYNNLSFFYCEAGNLEAAIKTYSQGEQFINKLLKYPQFSAAPMHTKGLLEYLKGNLAESEELFEKSKLQFNVNNHLLTSANLYLAKIYLQTSRTQKSKLLLDYNMLQKLFPNILLETQKAIEEMASTNSEK